MIYTDKSKLNELESEYNKLKIQLLELEDNPDHPNYRLILNKM